MIGHLHQGTVPLRIMSFLASRPAGYVANKVEIAAEEGTSVAYAQQLMMRLATAGLVNGVRG